MKFFNDPQFLYLMGVLWLILTSILGNTNTGNEPGLTMFVGFMFFGSLLMGIGHIVYAFFIYA